MYRDQGGVGAGAGARAGAEADWGKGGVLDLALDAALAPRLAAVALKYEACSSLTFIPRSMRRYLGFIEPRLSEAGPRSQMTWFNKKWLPEIDFDEAFRKAHNEIRTQWEKNREWFPTRRPLA